MTTTARPRRSVLYMPGSNARALEKGKSVSADGLILDLEDAVAPDAKVIARKQVVEAVRGGGYGKRELLIRVNAMNTPWGYEDLVTAAHAGAHAVLLPKVDSAETVRQADAVLSAAGAPASLRIWCMMETARGMLHAEQIAQSSARLGGLVMGTSDLAKELHCGHTPMRLPMITALGLCMLAARACGLPILDGVYLDLADDDGFRASCKQGVELGFDGKTLIHPKTVDVANEVFAPTEAEVMQARRIIEAFEVASSEGKGVVVVDGKLIENLHVENAKRLVAMADAIAHMA
jgi:citrate lyase subunit beta/citryl-CoA lyase